MRALFESQNLKTFNAMAGASIHITAAGGGSEAHNTREHDMKHIKKHLTHKNEQWVKAAISDRLASIKETYKNTVKRNLDKRATPIREGVVNLKPESTMDDLHRLAQRLEDKFGIKTFQIYIHRDEGVSDEKINHHAHMVFDWTASDGKSIKLNKLQMIEMQTVVAEVMEMERGKSSDLDHLNAIQYKNEAEKRKSEELRQEISDLSATKATKELVVDSIRAFGSLIGVKSESAEKQALFEENSHLSEQLEVAQVENSKLVSELGRVKYDAESERREYKQALEQKDRIIKEQKNDFDKKEKLIDTLLKAIYKEVKGLMVLTSIKEYIEKNCKAISVLFDMVEKPLEQDVKVEQTQEQKRGRKI